MLFNFIKSCSKNNKNLSSSKFLEDAAQDEGANILNKNDNRQFLLKLSHSQEERIIYVTENLGLQMFIVAKLCVCNTHTPQHSLERHCVNNGDKGTGTLFVIAETRNSLKIFRQKTENFTIYPFKRKKIIRMYGYGHTAKTHNYVKKVRVRNVYLVRPYVYLIC